MSLSRLMLAFVLLFQITVPLDKTLGQSGEENLRSAHIKCSISVESDSWSRGNPAYVILRIENISDGDVKFSAGYYFYIKNLAKEGLTRKYERLGDSFWSPAGMVTRNGQLVLVSNSLKDAIPINRTTRRFPNEEVQLRKGESAQLKVDLNQFRWQDRMSSTWPNQNFFDTVPKGKYQLEFEIDGKEEKAKSDPVVINVH